MVGGVRGWNGGTVNLLLLYSVLEVLYILHRKKSLDCDGRGGECVSNKRASKMASLAFGL